MSERDLPRNLHRWLTQEMRFTPPPGTAIPTPDDIRGICRGPMVDVWKFILAHVHSVQTVKKVKGNLALRDRKQLKKYKVQRGEKTPYSDEKDALAERQAQLTGEITQCLSDVKHMERDIERLEREIIQTEKSYCSGCEDLKNRQRRAALLRVYSKRTRETVAQYREFKHRIDGRVNSLTNKSSGDGAGFLRGEANGGESGLESVCARQVRDTCENIGSFLHATLQGSFAGDKKSFNERKQGLWSQVERTLSDLTVKQIIASLVGNTQMSATALHDKTMAINIKQDAEKLRFKFERVGQLRDLSTSTPLLMSVHHLLEESQLAHIHDFMTTERYLNQAFRLQQELELSHQKLGKLLTRTFMDRAGELQLAQKVIDAEIDVVRSRATLYALLDVKDRLQESIETSQKAREKMHLAYKKIHDFQEIADSKQNLIRVLSKQNLNARSRLDSQQLEILQYIQNSLSSHLAEIKATSSQLEGGVATEVDKFSSLVLPYLLHVYLDGATKVGILNLSINQASHPSAAAVRQSLHKTLDSLQFPQYKASECVLPWCMDLREELQLAIQITQSLEMADKKAQQSNGGSGSDILEDIAELRCEVTEQDKKQVERILPVLNKRLTQTGNGLGDCLKAHAALNDWWEQPAQSCVPWVKVDNETYKEWLDKWKILVTRLVQVQVQK